MDSAADTTASASTGAEEAYDFDLFTIGAGSGGVAASRRAASYGARVAICESSRVGGTCVLRGCVPKKLLVYGAQFAHELADAQGFGWTIGPSNHSWPELIRRKNQELDRLNGIYIRMLESAGVTILNGHGRVLDAHTVEVDGRKYSARHILIATGGHPWHPTIPGCELSISSNEALDLETLPQAIAIVGGGYIGCEFAGIFRALGSAVTLILRGDSILHGFDVDVRLQLTQELTQQGIQLLTRTQPIRMSLAPEGSPHRLNLELSDGQTLNVDQVLFATGRKPNTAGLGLESVGVALKPGGAIVVDEGSQTSVPSIFAVGDVTDQHNLTPVAIGQGRALAETLYNHNPRTLDPNFIPTAIFSDPPAATVGLSEEAALAAGHRVDLYRATFRPMKHTLSGRETRTMMKLVVDADSQRVLGCHMVGADAPEIIQGLAIALKCGATKAQFDATVGIHPSAAEEFVTMRDKARSNLVSTSSSSSRGHH